MRLKRLELQGFKSFADKTEISFDDGITAVVGPNGSGKSNISDAIRWVLGEQSAKTLRGSKMGDVIFSGTQNRKPVGFCQVSLVFDNEDHWLDIDFDEVNVTRRYYKSGESEYYINKKNCRLKDILELFRDTGVGKEGYSIIGQGQITNILSSNSADRRMAFEAATGVLTYKSRKAEAESRLSKTMDNASRLQDILNEMSINLESLEIQSKAAKEFVSCRDRLRELEISQYYYKHQKAQEKLGKNGAELEEIMDVLSQFDQRELELVSAKEEKSKEIETLGERMTHLREEFSRVHEEVLRGDSDRQLFEQRRESTNREQAGLNQENEQRKAQIAETKEKQKGLNAGLIQKRTLLSQLEKSYDDAVQKQAETKQLIAQKQAELDALKQSKIDYLNSVSEAKVNTSRYCAMLEQIEQRLGTIESNRAALMAKIAEMENEKEEYAKKLSLFDEKIEAQRAQVQALREAKTQGKERRFSLQQSIRELEIELSSLQSKINLLSNLQTGYEGYYESVKKLMRYCKQNGLQDKLLGTVADVIEVPGKFVTAIETALGSSLQNIITEDEDDARQLIRTLKEQRFGRATFLPLSAVKPVFLNSNEIASVKNCDGVFGVGSEIVKYQKKFQPCIEKLLGRTVVVEDLNTAIALMKQNGHRFTTVTLEGDIMFPGGAMTGGSKGGRQNGILSRGEALKRLQEQEALTKSELESRNADMAECQKEVSSAEERIAQLEDAIEKVMAESTGERTNDQTIAVQIASEQSKLEELEREKEQLLDNRSDIEGQLAEKDGSTAVSDVDDGILETLQSEVSSMNGLLETLQEELTQKLLDKTRIEKDIVNMESDLGRYQRRIERISGEMEQAEEKAKMLTLQLEELENQFSGKNNENSAQQKQENALREQMEDTEKQQQECKLIHGDYENQLTALREQNKQTIDRRYQLQLDLDKVKMEVEMMGQELFEKYDLRFDTINVSELLPETDVKGREVNSLKNRIRAMGNVNLNAIEDYAELHSRYQETKGQLEDMMASKKDLEDLIARLYQTMTEQFNAQFKVINEHFSRIFTALFGGGEASLKLGEGNAMECDIDIVAQPPGKKLQTISLLSGGEKALTAIAILFAMLELKPTPFCVLDEIEAALDEANVYGFADYLANYSHDTQFIVITHRRGVMDNCNTIYGVAMQEKGISKLVSLKMEA